MLELSLDCVPRTVEANSEGALRVTWDPDGHHSVYTAVWFRDNCPRPTAENPGHSGASLADSLQIINYDAVQRDDGAQLALRETVRDFGFALMQGVPSEPDEVERIAVHLGYIPGGWRYAAQPEDILVLPLRTPETKQADAVDSSSEFLLEANEHFQKTLLVPHTDLSFTLWPTELFIFHCLSPSLDAGGTSILVDGFDVANRLRREDPEAFQLLSTVR